MRPVTSPADLVRSEPTEDELAEFCVAIRRTAAVFSRNHVKRLMRLPAAAAAVRSK